MDASRRRFLADMVGLAGFGLLAPVVPFSLFSRNSRTLFRPPLAPESLHQAVTLPTAKKRAAAAKQLAKDRSVDLDQWLVWMEAFGTFEDLPQGSQTVVAPLMVGSKQEDTTLELFVPSSYNPRQPCPLLMLLHGSSGDGKGILRRWRGFAEENGFLLLAPHDPTSGGGYAFTQHERDAGMAALRWMRLHCNVDENRIHLHGSSRGGHMAWDLGLRFADRFASLVPAIGGPTWVVSGGRNNLRLVENLWDTPIRDLQGSQDDPRLLRNLHLSFDRLRAAGSEDAVLVEFPELGHSFRTDSVDWAAFFGAAERNPRPQRLLLRTARRNNPRHSWLRVERIDKSVQETFPIKVDPKQWQRWNEEERARFIQELADSRTAQVDAQREDDGSFRLRLQGVSRCKLLLPRDWLPKDGKLQVTVGDKTRKLKAKASRKTLLLDFVERFDRSFLPLAEVTVKP